jgi:putative tricarboxylic transport membrane protein
MTTYLIANFIFLILAIFFMKQFVKVLALPPALWPSLIFVIGIFAAYVIQGHMAGAWIAIALSLLAYLLDRTGFPLAPALLAFILGPLAETNLYRMVLTSKNDMIGFLLGRPIFLLLMFIAVFPILFKALGNVIGKKEKTAKVIDDDD